MAEKPVPESDPIVSKSLALHYFLAVVLLIGTLFWALWDEDFGQRPCTSFQHEWKGRYMVFLSSARSKSSASQNDVENSPQYQTLKTAYDSSMRDTSPRIREINEKLHDLSAKILAVQNVFTDRRAYVTALTYSIETETSGSSRQRKQKALSQYKQEVTSVAFPDGSKKNYNYDQLEETYNDLKNERTKLSTELGEVLKPLNEQKEKLDAFLSEHVVDLTPEQIRGLQNKTEAWDPKIVQINVAEANMVDRCESCHIGIREPVMIIAAAMSVQGKTPNGYAPAFTSHPETDLLKIHAPQKFRCSPCHHGNRPATTSVENAHGNYEHWLWPLFPAGNVDA